MYAVAPRKKKIFLESSKIDLSPRIISKRKFNEGNRIGPNENILLNEILTIELYCILNQRAILDEAVEEIKVFLVDSQDDPAKRKNLIRDSLQGDQDSSFKKTEVQNSKLGRLSKGEISISKRKFSNLNKTNNPFKIRQKLINVIYDIDKSNQDLTIERFSNLKFITKIDTNQILGSIKTKNIQNLKQTDEELFGYKEIFSIKRKSNYNSIDDQEKNVLIDTRKSSSNSDFQFSITNFKNNYFKEIKMGRDPLCSFAFKDDFSTIEEKCRGSLNMDKNRESDLRKSFREFARQKIVSSSTDLGFSVVKRKVLNTERVCKASFEISKTKIRNLTKKNEGILRLIFFAFDKSGRKIDSYQKSVSISDLLLTDVNPTMDFDINSVRNKKGNIITNVINKELKISNFNLYQKEFSRSQNYNNAIFSEVLENFSISPNNVLKLIDGKNQSPRTLSLSRNKTVFHRITTNFLNKEISNTKCSFVPSEESSENQLSCSVFVKQNIDEDSFEINVANISEDVYAVLPVKRVASGNRGTNFKVVQFLLNGNLVDTTKVFLKDENKNLPNYKISFTDSDIENDVIYEYAVFLYSKSGNKQLSGSKFLEKRSIREGLVEANITYKNLNNLSFDETTNQIKSSVEFEVLLERKEDDVDKILNSIFGDNRSLFNDDLSSIKDASNLLYGVRVHRIDTKTGECNFVGSFRGFKQEDKDAQPLGDIPKIYRATFIDSAPASDSQIYKFEPYLIPPAQVLDKVFDSLENIIKSKPRSNSSLNKLLVSKQKILNRNVISQIGSKYASLIGTKGAISSPKSFLEKNKNDLFLEGLTGDVVYVDLMPISGNELIQEIQISNSSIGIIKTLDKDTASRNYIPKSIVEINFSISRSDKLCDFYVVVKQINNDPNIIIDGAIHSKDSSDNLQEENYNYLSELRTSVGLIRYYIFGITKNGFLMGPAFLGSLTLEGE